jgi:DNA primase
VIANLHDSPARSHLFHLLVQEIGDPKKQGRQPFWLCPFHEDRRPSLTLMPDGEHWKCFGCGKSGDAIDWVRNRRELSFHEAVSFLQSNNIRCSVGTGSSPHSERTVRERSPDSAWQRRAGKVAADCVSRLHEVAGIQALDWLRERGLTPHTLRQWWIGFNPENQEMHGLWVAKGITLPWLHKGNVEAINIRRPDHALKYRMVAGSTRNGLYLGDAIRPGLPTLLVEGEFDALLGWQEVGDVMNVATLGSASARPDTRAIAHLLASPLILLAYDKDGAGTEGMRAWQRITQRAYPVCLPRGNDLTEFVQKGGDVGSWIHEELERVRGQTRQRPSPAIGQRSRGHD